MAPVVPNPDAIRSFADEAAFETWLRDNHDKAREVWIQFYKKGSGIPTVTYPQAVDVALCWGWIDGQSKSIDDTRYLQRYTPRGKKSIWSQKNRVNVARLTAAGRMQAPGQREVDAAKADGRWDNAYASPANMEPPPELLAAIAATPGAADTYGKLNATNRYAMNFRLHNLKTPAGKETAIARFVEMLARGETIHPNGKAK